MLYGGNKGFLSYQILKIFNMARKISGGRYKSLRKKKLIETPGKPRHTKLGKDKTKIMKGRGGILKRVSLASENALVLDPKTKKSKKVKIKGVVKSLANRYFKSIMVKGTIIDTELGKARITNRPGQEGTISAILIEE